MDANFSRLSTIPKSLENDSKDDDSAITKVIGESSITTSTIAPRNNESYNGELVIVDWLLMNVFTKLTNFWDFIGRKQIFSVDWDYLSR